MSGTTTTGVTASTATSTTAASTGSNALASLSGNFNSFLTLLTTQLQNQDPSSPMDSNQFTTELVQFAGVEQQINTNSSLTQLIQLTQGGTVMQSTQLLGKRVEVSSDQLALQNGSATVDFTAPSAGPVAISVSNAAGTTLYQTTVDAQAGSNTWTWDGSTVSGLTAPDGAYKVAFTGSAVSGGTALPFTVVGTATGVQQQGNSVQLDLGPLPVDISALKSVVN